MIDTAPFISTESGTTYIRAPARHDGVRGGRGKGELVAASPMPKSRASGSQADILFLGILTSSEMMSLTFPMALILWQEPLKTVQQARFRTSQIRILPSPWPNARNWSSGENTMLLTSFKLLLMIFRE